MDTIIKKYWKVVLLATIVIFLFIPFDILINKGAILQTQEEYIQLAEDENAVQIKEFANAYLNSAVQYKLYSVLNIVILLIYPVALSAIMFKEQRGKKLTKEFLAGQAAFLIVPYVINAIILVGIKLFAGITEYLSFIEILKWFGASILVSAFIATISNFVGVFAKTRASHIVSVYALLFVPLLIAFAIEKLLQTVVFGFVGYSDAFMNVLTEWPGLKIFALFSYDYTANMYIANFGILHILAYIAIIAGLTFAIYKLLNKEKQYNVIPMIIIYSAVFILTAAFIGSISIMTNIMLATLLSLLIVGVIYAIIVLFLKEKNIKKLAISYAVYSVIILVLIFVIQNNIFGFEKNIPNADDVDYAIFSTNNPLTTSDNIVYKEADNIKYIINRQTEIVDKQTTIRDSGKTYYTYYIQYALKNGKQITRAYTLEPTYEAIYDSKEFIEQRYKYILNEEQNSKVTEISVLGIYNNKAFEISTKKEEALFEEIIKAIKTDINENKSYKEIENEYGKYNEKEGLTILTADVTVGTSTAQTYVAYASINEKYELVKIVQKLINENSELLKWEE